MKRFIIFLAVIAVAAGIIFYPKQKPSQNTEQPKIAVTIFPLADIARATFGDQVEVLQVLPTGSSEHIFELTPQIAANLASTGMLFYIGQGLDDNWAEPVLKANPHIQAVDLSAGMQLLASQDEHEPGNDPHYWLSYGNAPQIAKTMLSEVIKKYPGLDLSKLQNNLSAWLTDVEKSKQRSQQLIASIAAEKKQLVTFHNGWQYFAREFGLTIAGVFEEFAGKEPTPQELVGLQKLIREKGITVVYSEPQFSPAALNSLAADLNLQIKQLDPMGGTSGRDSFIKLMEYNVEQIVR